MIEVKDNYMKSIRFNCMNLIKFNIGGFLCRLDNNVCCKTFDMPHSTEEEKAAYMKYYSRSLGEETIEIIHGRAEEYADYYTNHHTDDLYIWLYYSKFYALLWESQICKLLGFNY